MPEALLQFDKVTDEPYVEVEVGEQKFERRDIQIGISDGINVEILEGLTESDKVKQWNKTEPIKVESEEAPNRGV
jgi:HlyD family secretion protein